MTGSLSDAWIGRYQLLRLLAAGGMGEVFLARAAGPAGFSKLVVVKRILRHMSADPTFVEMFLNEARLAALLSHPNIVQIFELGEEDGSYFIVMEYVHGLSLHGLQRKLRALGVRFPPYLSAHIGMQALQGLQYAHELRDAQGHPMNIVHRDVTPDNLLMGFDGMVKVADFGIAKATTSVPTTAAGTIKGKFAYLSPEQLHGQPLDKRADLFSMGVVLYSLLGGQLPFSGGSEAAIVHSVLHHTPRPLNSLNPEITPELSAVLEQALAKEPSQRFPSAEAMGAALEACLISSAARVSHTSVSRFLHELLPPEMLKPLSVSEELASLPRTPSARKSSSPSHSQSRSVSIDLDPPRRRPFLFLGGLVAAAALGVLLFRAMDRRVDPKPAPVAQLNVLLDAGAWVEPPAPVQAQAPPPDPIVEPIPDAPGTVDVRVNPWAEVYLEGKKLGITPMRPFPMRAGPHLFTLRNPELGVERKVKVNVLPGRRVTLKADMLE